MKLLVLALLIANGALFWWITQTPSQPGAEITFNIPQLALPAAPAPGNGDQSTP